MALKSSAAAVNLIVSFEVSSEADYNKLYQIPTWPGGLSGVTIAIGYDCGYSTTAQIRADWGPLLPASMVEALAQTAGIHGSPASSHAHALRGTVTVPWVAAMSVFQDRDMPKWEATVTHDLPNTDLLSGDSFGALVSLAYNRGPSFDLLGDRYNEMRAIKTNMGLKRFYVIPQNIRGMERLWPNVAGLRTRRQQEAALFQKGLISAPTVGLTPPVITAVIAAPKPLAIVHNARWVQANLNSLGQHPPLTVDGSYGPGTEAAVKNFQIAYKLEPDGLAGEETCAKITELITRKGK